MSTSDSVRIDKYLWAIRLFKTRTLATEHIESGKVKHNQQTIKASKKIQIGEVYTIRRAEWIKEIKVLKIIDKRVSALLAQECYEIISETDLSTPKIESVFFAPNITRSKGSGRPTKKERRDLDELSRL